MQNKQYSEKITVDATVRSTVTGVILLPAEDLVMLPMARTPDPSLRVEPASRDLPLLAEASVVAEASSADAGDVVADAEAVQVREGGVGGGPESGAR